MKKVKTPGCGGHFLLVFKEMNFSLNAVDIET